jgi:hypothetical protein
MSARVAATARIAELPGSRRTRAHLRALGPRPRHQMVRAIQDDESRELLDACLDRNDVDRVRLAGSRVPWSRCPCASPPTEERILPTLTPRRRVFADALIAANRSTIARSGQTNGAPHVINGSSRASLCSRHVRRARGGSASLADHVGGVSRTGPCSSLPAVLRCTAVFQSRRLV